MRIVFFGEDSFSAIVLESIIKEGYEVKGVFCPKYSNNIFSKLSVVCKSNNLYFERILDVSSDCFFEKLKQLNPQLIVVCHFQKLIQKRIIELPEMGCINLHPSLLPNYRGMSPQHWPIILGDKVTGITVHFIDVGVDTGDIIIQKSVEIEDNETVFHLQTKFKIIYAYIVIEAIKKIVSGSKLFIKQSHLIGSYFGRLKRKDCLINLEGSTAEAYNLIRAVTFPYFGARVYSIIIWKATLMKENLEFLNNSPQGLIFVNEKLEYIKFFDGTLKIDKYERYSE
jgi:methionyl-tRNA formyltransferase